MDHDPAYDSRPLRDIFGDAVAMWEDLTNVPLEGKSYSMGSMGVHGMNRSLRKALEMDPSGLTSYMMLECFLRHFLEEKTFSAAQIMKDYAATTAFLSKAEALFACVQSERATEEMSGFRALVRKALAAYGADRPDVLEMTGSNDALPFLRRDALLSMETLTPYQFLSGEEDAAVPGVIRHVYSAWSVNDVLASARDMMVSGIAVVLIRDGNNPDRSYFAFVMRNGGNVIIFTDKSRPAYPGQTDALAARGGRGMARAFAERENANHFPYQIIPTSIDEEGDLVFDAETALVPGDRKVVPMMPISELPASQAIWVTMMLSLLSERFWKKGWRAPALSYTGQMVRKKNALVTDPSGNLLPQAAGYREISLEEVRLEEVSAEAMRAQGASTDGVHAWLEELYAADVTPEVLNLWADEASGVAFLPAARQDRMSRGTEIALQAGGVARATKDQLNSMFGVKGYALSSFNPNDFGTEQQMAEDRLYIARRNLAQHVRKKANDEFELRKDDIRAWFRSALKRNLPNLLSEIAGMAVGDEVYVPDPESGGRNMRCLWARLEDLKAEVRFGSHIPHHVLGEIDSAMKYRCVVNDAVASYRAVFVPRHADHVARLTGVAREDLPVFLRHWTGRRPNLSRNSLLDRVDPMDSELHDPWSEFGLNVGVHLSRSGYAKIRKAHAVSAPRT